jgi:drug/metabolite transporter (DMT)-like permease
LAQTRPKPATIAALLLLCLLWAAVTLRSDLSPRGAERIGVSPMRHEALILGSFAGLAAIAALIRQQGLPERKTVAEALLAGVGMFVVPTLVNEFGKGSISDTTRVALFSLTPMFAVVFEPYLGAGSAAGGRGSLLAAMVAVAGTALVFPIEIPRSGGSFLAFCGVLLSAASVAAANCLAVRACRKGSTSPLVFGAFCAGVAAICLGGVGAMVPQSRVDNLAVDAWAAADLLALALLFWLMPRMSSVRMTTRFVIAPLLANLAGLALIRPKILWQTWIGLLAIALGSGWLLFAPDEPAEAQGTLLKLN